MERISYNFFLEEQGWSNRRVVHYTRWFLQSTWAIFFIFFLLLTDKPKFIEPWNTEINIYFGPVISVRDSTNNSGTLVQLISRSQNVDHSNITGSYNDESSKYAKNGSIRHWSTSNYFSSTGRVQFLFLIIGCEAFNDENFTVKFIKSLRQRSWGSCRLGSYDTSPYMMYHPFLKINAQIDTIVFWSLWLDS